MMRGQNQMFRALIVGVKNELFILDCRINIGPYWIFIYVSLGIACLEWGNEPYNIGREHRGCWEIRNACRNPRLRTPASLNPIHCILIVHNFLLQCIGVKYLANY